MTLRQLHDRRRRESIDAQGEAAFCCIRFVSTKFDTSVMTRRKEKAAEENEHEEF
jgi:hypothetical protein